MQKKPSPSPKVATGRTIGQNLKRTLALVNKAASADAVVSGGCR